MRGEYGAEKEDVEFGLVVPYQHARSRVEILLAVDDFEMYARRQRHGVVESSGGGPLADSVLAEEAQDERGEDAVCSAENEAAVGGEETGVEGSCWDGEVGQGEECGCEAEVEGQEAEDGHDECLHCR